MNRTELERISRFVSTFRSKRCVDVAKRDVVIYNCTLEVVYIVL